MKEDSFFTQGVTMQTIGNEGRLIIHKKSYNVNNGRHIVHTRSYNANNG
ncbi:hypothetical protein KSS87_006566 [Heliosperma pusillum]|nr:hypothetical protein KSS87_006566 [Heliosperma pusillum]